MPSVAEYHRELCTRLRSLLADELVGVYAGGSFALGDFDAGRSDLDVVAVTRGRLRRDRKRRIVRALRHEALPCPARGLELVVYRAEIAGHPTDEAGFELNLNTGERVDDRVDFEPGTVERHWFPVDRAILADRGVALCGPPAAEVFAPMPRELLRPVIRESLEWHRLHGSGDDDAVLNACRASRYLCDGTWSSKGEAGEWALGRVADPGLVTAALRSRSRRAQLGRDRVEALIDEVLSKAG